MNPANSKKPSKARVPRAVLKVLAGAALTKPAELLQLAAHAGDRMLKKEFSMAVFETYSYFMNKGQIDQAYFDTSTFADLAPEFKTVHDNSYGIDKLNTLRRVFVNLALDNGAASHKKYLLDIALLMSEPEIKVLIGDYTQRSVAETMIGPAGFMQAITWHQHIAAVTGLKHEVLVSIASKDLIGRGLMNGYLYGDNSGIGITPPNGRLTPMGIELASLMLLDDDPIEKII